MTEHPMTCTDTTPCEWVSDAVREYAETRTQRDSGFASASNIGNCTRQLWFLEHGTKPEPVPWQTILKWDMGTHGVEPYAVRLLEKALTHKYGDGVLHLPDREDGMRLEPFEHRVRPDLVFAPDGEVIPCDVKGTESNYKFPRAEEGIIDWTYACQLECYMRVLDAKKSVLFVVRLGIRKGPVTSAPLALEVQRDDARWQWIKDAYAIAKGDICPSAPFPLTETCGRCNGTGRTPAGRRECLECKGAPDTRAGMLTNFPCGYCPVKEACWGPLDRWFEDDKPKFRPKDHLSARLKASIT